MKNKVFEGRDIILLVSSVIFIVVSFIIFDRTGYLSLIASLVGVSSLILCAKGQPAGQVLMIVFSILYGIISFTFNYYGEMITYLGMSMPMAVLSLISWIKNPARKGESEVRVREISRHEVCFMLLLSLAVGIAFFFILGAFNTANLFPSTLSVTTSFIAAYLTFKRSEYYALAYALNDIVLIALWILAAITDRSYISVIICFIVFLVNDIYGFISWRMMKKRQGR